MSGKSFLVALGAGLITGVIMYFYDTSVGPQINKALSGATGGAA